MIARDKVLHFAAGVIVFAVFMFVGAPFAAAHFWLGTYALYAVLCCAVIKESYDATHKGDKSNYDILATISGGVAGYVCSIN